MTPKARAKKGGDDGKRGAFGLVISMVRRPRGRVELVFDDVVGVEHARPAQWTTKFFFTSLGFDWDDVLNVRLKDKDLETIGFAVAVRLAAQHKVRLRSK